MAPPFPIYFQAPQTPIPTPPNKRREPNARPILRFQIEDVSHDATSKFLTAVKVDGCLKLAVDTVLYILYPSTTQWPGTRSITLILDPMGGVAYTKGIAIDNDHKEIHLSLPYINHIQPDTTADSTSCPHNSPSSLTSLHPHSQPTRLTHEMAGVIVHEMVHCWQHNGRGEAPGGLIEGVADWVRLRAGLSPPHWNAKDKGDKWDAGYQHTAYFLDWLEKRYGAGTVPGINDDLRREKYDEKSLWSNRFGKSVHELWQEYLKSS